MAPPSRLLRRRATGATHARSAEAGYLSVQAETTETAAISVELSANSVPCSCRAPTKGRP